METKNALIKATTLGCEDNGIFTFYLHLDYGGSGQAAGGYALDTPTRDKNGQFIKRVGTAGGMQLISEILKVVGVTKWEDLPGQHIRVRGTYDTIYEIGNFLKDDWLNFNQFFKDAF